MYPCSSDDQAWTAELVNKIADAAAEGWDGGWVDATPTMVTISPAELVDVYGTADPVVLRSMWVPAEDIAAAERYAAENNRVSA